MVRDCAGGCKGSSCGSFKDARLNWPLWGDPVFLFLFLACATPEPVPPAPAKLQESPIQSTDDLSRVLAIARLCMLDGNPEMILMAHEVVTPAEDGQWEVSIRDGAQEAHTVVVDPVGGRCGDLQVEVALGEVLGALPDLFESAWACGQELGGTGVSGTPLVRDGMLLHSEVGRKVNFSIAEANPHTMPRGKDLSVHKGCHGLVMD